MTRGKAPKRPTPVEANTHAEKRLNLPTADAQELVDPALVEAKRVWHDRKVASPELLWRGKDEAGLDVEAPPIYIQEKIDPRVLIENLRETADGGDAEPELTLFETFDGLDDLDSIDFYRHEANWSNRMILGDSLQVMSSLAEREQLRGQVQMVYIDPPYGIKFGSNWQVSARKRDVKDGKLEDAAREAEQIKAFRDTWELGIHSYLSYLRDRLVVARDLLTESGSCFVQIGDENVHLVRSLMDEVFGSENFVSQITFVKTSGSTSEFGGTADLVVWYGKNRSELKFRQPYLTKVTGGAGGSGYTRVLLPDGTMRPLSPEERVKNALLPTGSRIFAGDNLTSQSLGREKGEGAASWFKVRVGDRDYDPGLQARWKTNQSGMARLQLADRVMATTGKNLAYVRYLDDFPAVPLTNVWTDTLGQNQFGGDKLYVVQTALPVTQRCMLMCTDPGDLVVDPTCGSGTTAYVAEQWGRRWITIDTSRVALALARQRLMGAKYPYYLLADSEAGRRKEWELAGGRLVDTASAGFDSGSAVTSSTATSNDVRRGFVYERVQHITLKSIANNPDIKEGMTRAEIDAAIKRHAEFEKLYDKPYEDKGTVRVTGPFTVESLSPHRSLAFAADVQEQHASRSEAVGAASGPSFEQSILDNLAKAGIQNGQRNERIEFASLEAYAGAYVQAVGERVFSTATRAASSRVAIALGPQYGTVSPAFIKEAAKEAIQDESIDLLCILGFSFDPQAGEVGEEGQVEVEQSDFAGVVGQRRIGRVPVLYVRMNVDLLMGEELAKTKNANLFTVFGEPDISISTTDDGSVTVDLVGVDVYDPTTGDVRSDDTSRIALWMIDSNYNGESFFVRHCYFTGGTDPYKRLKTALKADIDADAWASLNSTTSRPFERPGTGKIAVKVINDYGDEVMKVFDV